MFEELQAEIDAYRTEISDWRMQLTSSGTALRLRLPSRPAHWSDASARLREAGRYWLEPRLLRMGGWLGEGPQRTGRASSAEKTARSLARMVAWRADDTIFAPVRSVT